MKSPPKQKRAPAKSALQRLQLKTAYHLAAFYTEIFGWPFWFFEQWRGKLADRIDNNRSGR